MDMSTIWQAKHGHLIGSITNNSGQLSSDWCNVKESIKINIQFGQKYKEGTYESLNDKIYLLYQSIF